SLPSWVAPTCDPSGGTKVMEHIFGLSDRRVQREAGLTEQRAPPALDSGGITGCCTTAHKAW
ncbi:hypothetical protein L195_g041872, partial [Trifolium pratense]